jgi:transposase
VVQALLAAGYLVYAINPLQAARYRERHTSSGAKSDPGDAHVLAEVVRLDRAHHRPIAGDTALAEHVKIVARAHQSMVWSRQRQTNTLRSMLREYYPGALSVFGDDLAGRDALAVLTVAPTPEQGARLGEHQVAAVLRRAGRQRNITTRAAGIVAGLRAEQLTARPGVVGAYAAAAQALLAVIGELARQTQVLAGEVEAGFGRHPDVEIYLSQPGLGQILGARVLAEFGDDPDRYSDARARKNYSGMAPVTRTSGKSRAVLAPTPVTGAWPTRSTNKPSPSLRRPEQLTRGPRLLRHPPSPRQHPPPSPPRPGQPARRHPARLPPPPHPLRRNPRLGRPYRSCRLTPTSRGMSRRYGGPGWGLTACDRGCRAGVGPGR